VLGPEEYVEHIGRVKRAVAIPVIASLNGTSRGGWLEYGREIAQAGADELKATVKIPVAVKLSPFYTSLPHFVSRLESVGVDGVVLFNRFYQPDIDPEGLALKSQLQLSTSAELPLRLQWLALLKDRARCSLAATGGIHDGRDAVKAVMAGADAVQLVSALLHGGPARLQVVLTEMIGWMEEHVYESLAQMKGSMSRAAC